jgi:hypothetical protein
LAAACAIAAVLAIVTAFSFFALGRF